MVISNGCSVDIPSIGNGCFSTSYDPLLLKDLLYVPTIHKNLLSVSKFAKNNYLF